MTSDNSKLFQYLKKELEKLRRQYNTRKTGPTVEQILDEDRADRV